MSKLLMGQISNQGRDYPDDSAEQIPEIQAVIEKLRERLANELAKPPITVTFSKEQSDG